MSRLTLNFTQVDDCIQGTIDLPADLTFTMECLAMLVEGFAKQAKIPAAEVVQDLYALVLGKVGT